MEQIVAILPSILEQFHNTGAGNLRLSEFELLLVDLLARLGNCEAAQLEHEVDVVFRRRDRKSVV